MPILNSCSRRYVSIVLSFTLDSMRSSSSKPVTGQLLRYLKPPWLQIRTFHPIASKISQLALYFPSLVARKLAVWRLVMSDIPTPHHCIPSTGPALPPSKRSLPSQMLSQWAAYIVVSVRERRACHETTDRRLFLWSCGRS